MLDFHTLGVTDPSAILQHYIKPYKIQCKESQMFERILLET